MCAEPLHDRSKPSAFFDAQLPRLRSAAALGAVVDLACGRGRHALAAAAAGLRVIGIDRDRSLLAQLRADAGECRAALDCVCADLEHPAELPLRSRRCGAILVFRYLHRPLMTAIARALAPGGLLIYETFTTRQRALGTGPRNPDFLLEPDELRALCSGLEILEYWEGATGGRDNAELARVVARAPERA
ncbi:MAG TPA: class I SAM-dependent methyltransferase [Myxococcota bacterium]|nr:class I SAM-dependent methyltransferase [Myxococcota bacterium]